MVLVDKEVVLEEEVRLEGAVVVVLEGAVVKVAAEAGGFQEETHPEKDHQVIKSRILTWVINSSQKI